MPRLTGFAGMIVKNTFNAVFIASLVYNSRRFGQSNTIGHSETAPLQRGGSVKIWGNTDRFKLPTPRVVAVVRDQKTL